MSDTVSVIPKHSITHGSYKLRRGVAVDLPAAIASDLAKAGLVSVQAVAASADEKQAPEPDNKAAPARKTKAVAEPAETETETAEAA